MLRETNFLAGPGLGIVIGKVTLWKGLKLVAKMWLSSERRKSSNIWMGGNCGGHPKEFHGGQSSCSVGIECYSPRERPFSLGWCVPIFGGHCGCEVEASVRRSL
eukprot:1140980-Pelagomonas_calceolata.AAC.1